MAWDQKKSAPFIACSLTCASITEHVVWLVHASVCVHWVLALPFFTGTSMNLACVLRSSCCHVVKWYIRLVSPQGENCPGRHKSCWLRVALSEEAAVCIESWSQRHQFPKFIQIHPNSPFTVNSLILWDSTATLSQHWKDVQSWINLFDIVLGTCGMQPSIWASNVGAEEAAGARNLETWATFGGSNNLKDLGDDKTSWILHFTNDRLDSTKGRQWAYYDSCVWVLIGLEVLENQSHMFAAHSTQMLYIINYIYILYIL